MCMDKHGGHENKCPIIIMDKEILDVCCGGRMMWFDKKHPKATYCDLRNKPKGTLPSQKGWSIEPDVVSDFKSLPFGVDSFSLVVFDPPHILRKLPERAKFTMQYGSLNPETWKDDIRDGFNECMRVLKPNGVLIFKWSQSDVKLKEILDILPVKPLFGHPTGKIGKTIWMCFMKF